MSFKYEGLGFYKTRDGEKVQIVHDFGEETAKGGDRFVVVSGLRVCDWYCSSGRFVESQESAYDLIEKWIEPRTQDVWVNVYYDDASDDGLGLHIREGGHTSREEADDAAAVSWDTLVGRKKITLIVGQWDEE